MGSLAYRHWVPDTVESHVQALASHASGLGNDGIARHVATLVERSRAIHEKECFNLNPASNVMNPRAEAMLCSGLGSRASLGYPGDKYETGLEAIEEIEVIAAALAAEVFNARFAEIRVPSGAIANLYGFMATCRPGDNIVVPPASVGGHVTHHAAGCAGLYGLTIHEAPVADDGYTVDATGLAELARRVKPRLITLGGSLNLVPHPVAEVRAIADEVGATLMFDAAHQCGIIAGGAWPDPLAEGAHFMTMSTYKSLGGPAGGLIVTNDAGLAERFDRIAFPGMTANFDVSKSAALAISLLDWRAHGQAYARMMVRVAQAMARSLAAAGIPVYPGSRQPGDDTPYTRSHQFAIEAARYGGGQAVSRRLYQAGFLACGIGLPIAQLAGDLNGLRIGTPEIVRWGVDEVAACTLAELLARSLAARDVETLARLRADVSEFRQQFQSLHYVNG